MLYVFLVTIQVSTIIYDKYGVQINIYIDIINHILQHNIVVYIITIKHIKRKHYFV